VELYLHAEIRLQGMVLSKSTGTTLPFTLLYKQLVIALALDTVVFKLPNEVCTFQNCKYEILHSSYEPHFRKLNLNCTGSTWGGDTKGPALSAVSASLKHPQLGLR